MRPKWTLQDLTRTRKNNLFFRVRCLSHNRTLLDLTGPYTTLLLIVFGVLLINYLLNQLRGLQELSLLKIQDFRYKGSVLFQHDLETTSKGFNFLLPSAICGFQNSQIYCNAIYKNATLFWYLFGLFFVKKLPFSGSRGFSQQNFDLLEPEPESSFEEGSPNMKL